MIRIGLGVLLGLACTAVLAQTTTCQEFAGGLIKCSTPQGLSPVPSVTNCQTGIGSISCSQPQGIQPVQPPTTYYPPVTTVITSPQPSVPNFLQQQREEMERSREQADSAREQLRLKEYREQQLDLQKKQLELLEEQQAQRTEATIDQSSKNTEGNVTQQMVECGNNYGCDTSILHKKGGPRSITGENWLNAMNQPEQSQVHVWAMLMAGNVFFGWSGKSHCPPTNKISLNQAAAVAKLYLEGHPQLWNYPAPDLIGVALGNVWPCHTPDHTPSK